MSADNGNYFCSFPTETGEREIFIVWNGSDSVMNDLNDPTILWGEEYARVFTQFFEDAEGPYSGDVASELYRSDVINSNDYTEYGNCWIVFDHYFDKPYQERMDYPLSYGACPRCSTRSTMIFHSNGCDEDADSAKNRFSDALKERWGIKNDLSPLNFRAIVNNIWNTLEDLDLLK